MSVLEFKVTIFHEKACKNNQVKIYIYPNFIIDVIWSILLLKLYEIGQFVFP